MRVSNQKLGLQNLVKFLVAVYLIKILYIGVISNKIYIGKIIYKKEEFKGLHSPIIDETKFNQVNKQLNVSKNDRFTSQIDSELLLLGRIKMWVLRW